MSKSEGKLGKPCRLRLKDNLVKDNLVEFDDDNRVRLWETVLHQMTRWGERSMHRRFTSPLSTFLRSFYHDQSPK